jgi:hypothetical protein
MSRPAGVTLVAIAVAGTTAWTVWQAFTHHAGRSGQRFLVAAALLAVLGVVASGALWTLRSYAFLAFNLWALCGIVCVVLFRMSLGSIHHGIRLFGPILYAGLAYIAAALFLRRAV